MKAYFNSISVYPFTYKMRQFNVVNELQKEI